MIEGKTIARVIDDPDSPYIVFTDGSGIRISGYEGADFSEVDAQEIAEHEARRAAEVQAAEHADAYQRAWMMRSCEERAEIFAEWSAQQPKGLIPYGWHFVIEDDLVYGMSRLPFGGDGPKLKARCPRCNEQQCPNAPDYKPLSRGMFHQSGTITIPVVKKTKARRS